MNTVDNRTTSRFSDVTDLQHIWRELAHRRLSGVLRDAKEILFDDSSRFVFFSDSHRGDRGRSDAFTANEPLFLQALMYYYRQGFTYVEVGDGDELWENRHFNDVFASHRPVFNMLHRFDLQGRLHLILGNHDMPSRRHNPTNKDGLRLQEGLILRHRRTQQGIFVTHGHQADIVSDWLAPVSRFVVRHMWRHIRKWGLHHLVPGEHPNLLMERIEQRIVSWVDVFEQAVICGHTHHAAIADYGSVPYFNTGSWLRPGVATGLEIQGGDISLVRWIADSVTHDVRRELVAAPRRLRLFA